MKRIPFPRSRRGRAGRPLFTFLLVLTAAVTALVAPATAASADTNRVEITNSYSGLKADVVWGSSNPYQRVFLWPNNASASQEFNLLDSGGGYFRIQARHDGQCLMLDWRSGTYGNGNAVIQYPYCAAGYAPAEWYRRTLSGTRCSGNVCTTGVDQMVLVNRRTGRCLDAANGAGGRPPAQSMLQEWDCVTSTSAWNIGNQAWFIAPPGAVRID